MMIQTDLSFSFSRARAGDPESSHLAADSTAESSKRQAQFVWWWLRRYPGSTCRELAAQMADENEWEMYTPDHDHRYYNDICHRRLSDLRNAGLATNAELRKCQISGRLSQTWSVK